MKDEIIRSLGEDNRPHPPSLPLLVREGGVRKITLFAPLSSPPSLPPKREEDKEKLLTLRGWR